MPGRAKTTRALVRSGLVAGPVFVGTFLVAGAVRPDYDPLRHPVSSLALGPDGWVQTANFAVAGALNLAYAVGLVAARPAPAATRVGPILIAAAGIGLLGSAVFLTDPVSGYPPGTPDALTGYSSAVAALHDLSAVPVFLGLPAAAFIYARAFWRSGDRAWAIGSAGCGALMLLAFGLASAGFNQVPELVDLGGLFQRTSIVLGLGWLTALAARTLRDQDPTPRR